MIDKIKIGAVTYAVSEEPDLHTFDNEWKKEFLNGHIVYTDATIKVNAALNHDMKVCALWHEAVHGMLTNAGQDDHKEAHVVALGYALAAFVRDNPELIAFTVGNQEHPQVDSYVHQGVLYVFNRETERFDAQS